MSYNAKVADHYSSGRLLESIRHALAEAGKSIDEVQIEDLAPVDEFHIGGRKATQHLLNQLDIKPTHHVLDVGCGLGGAARLIASAYGCCVTGIDLTKEFVEVGRVLNEWVSLDQQVILLHGSALALPQEDNSFNGATMLHVGMNIQDKAALFREAYRVLQPGSFLGIYDIMQTAEGRLRYPVPWATKPDTSFLATPEQYATALAAAGFQVAGKTIRRDFALSFFRDMRQKKEAKKEKPAIGLHVLMQESTDTKIANMVQNIEAGLIAPVELIAYK